MKRLLIVALSLAFAAGLSAQSSTTFYPPLAGQPVYGEIFVDDTSGGSDDITLTTGSTYYPFITATAGESQGVTIDVADATGDSIKANTTGEYQILLTASFDATVNTTYHCYVFVNGTIDTHIGFFRKIGASSDVGSASASGVFNVQSGQKVQFKCTASADTKVIDFWHANLSIFLIK